MILEGIVTTVDSDGVINIAPMGPRVEPDMKRLVLRPYNTSQTYRNLKVHGEGVFHVTDDVLLLAHAAVGAIDPPPLMVPATRIRGHVLQEACRFYEFQVRGMDETRERIEIEAEVMAVGRLRDFLGFNRGKHAVVEAAILATRLHLLPIGDIQKEMKRLAVLVEKTGGPAEHQAFRFLEDYIERTTKGAIA